MSQLGDNLKLAAAHEVAKVATYRKVTLADDDIDALAARITSVVLEELASRELHGREVASRDETTNTWAEHSVRIDEYAEAARDLRVAVSGEDRPTPAPRLWLNLDREPQGVRAVRDSSGYIWNLNDRNGLWYCDGMAPRPWGELPSGEITEVLSEVVTPEGPA